jgi:aspartyl protease family protein
MSETNIPNIIYYILLILFVGSGVLFHYRNKFGKAVKDASIWLVIILAIVLLYSSRYKFIDIKDQLVAALSPSSAISNEDGSLSFRAAQDGHFYINTEVNGKNVRFMVDTGASDIVMDKDTARKIGINLNQLNYIKTYHTANGIVRGAPIRIEKIKIDNYILTNVRASVNEADMNKPLLGMSFLNGLEGYEVKRGTLTIWP